MISVKIKATLEAINWYPGRGGGGVGIWVVLSGYVSRTSQSPYPIIVYSVANYRPYLSHVWANM